MRDRFKLFSVNQEYTDAKGRLADARAIEKRLGEKGTSPFFEQSVANCYCAAAIAFYLEGDDVKAKELGQSCVKSATQYLLGDWRSKVPTDDGKIDPEWWHDFESWMSLFRQAATWAAVLGDWKSLKRLCEYPDDRCGMDTINATPASRFLLIELAKFVRGEKVKDVARRGEPLKGYVKKVDKLCATLDGIIQRDADQVATSLIAYLESHHKRKPTPDITETVSLDATLVYRLAEKEKLKVPIPEKLSKYILAPQ